MSYILSLLFLTRNKKRLIPHDKGQVVITCGTTLIFALSEQTLFEYNNGTQTVAAYLMFSSAARKGTSPDFFILRFSALTAAL